MAWTMQRRVRASLLSVTMLGGACSAAVPPSAASTPAGTTLQTAEPSVAGFPPLTGAFTSDVHGISIAYPAGWIPRAATKPWPAGEIVMQESDFGDIIQDPAGDNVFLALASRRIVAESFKAFAADYIGLESCGTAQPITVDAAPGFIGSTCPLAMVQAGGRAYLVWLYNIDDLAWFRQLLATVELSPETAIDAAPAAS